MWKRPEGKEVLGRSNGKSLSPQVVPVPNTERPSKASGMSNGVPSVKRKNSRSPSPPVKKRKRSPSPSARKRRRSPSPSLKRRKPSPPPTNDLDTTATTIAGSQSTNKVSKSGSKKPGAETERRTKTAERSDVGSKTSKSQDKDDIKEKGSKREKVAVATSGSTRLHASSAPVDHRHLSKKADSPCINAVDIVSPNLNIYYQFSDRLPMIKATSDFETVELEYPGTNAREIFPLLNVKRAEEYNPILDISQTVQNVASYCIDPEQGKPFGDNRKGIIRNVIKACNKKNGVELKEALKEFNSIMRTLKRDGVFSTSESHGAAAPFNLVSHIMEQAYARAVSAEAHKLNTYEGFSNNVYGEVRHRLVDDMIREANIQPHHVFLDMGSGIGNVVLQVAAQCLCDCYGVEVMPTPAELGRKQKHEFLSRLRWASDDVGFDLVEAVLMLFDLRDRYYAKPCGRITLRHADFLDDKDIHEILKDADVIFVNNYAFRPELNQMILALFLDLKEGAKVISLRSFVPKTGRGQARRSNAMESIFTCEEFMFAEGSVSWMAESGVYYIHTVNRSQLANR
ncbi:Nucleosomal histone H3-Lys79 methylase [Rhizophlyctis rosea]|nr:Nucleosomal histone H3-Lys79 methylase [Rhizophlyctis rosea]